MIKRAKGGDPEVLFSIGVAYGKGEGVPQDYLLAFFWWSLAASKGSGADYDRCVNYRDSAAGRLNPEQLVKARQKITDWEATHPGK